MTSGLRPLSLPLVVLLVLRERLLTKKNKVEALSLNCGDGFGHCADWYVSARPSQPEDTLNPVLRRRVSIPAWAVLGRLSALYTGEGHCLAINEHGRVL